MTEPVITVENATLRLRLLGMQKSKKKKGAPAPSVKVGGRIVNALWGSHIVALDDVSVEILNGDRVALIGHNGAGKTTFLRMLAGIYTPSEGRCIVRGKPSCLFSPGLGLHQNASLRENARLALALYGTDFRRIESMIPEILDFAELTEFADAPLNACSAGMKARLGFAVATSISPGVFLVDEAISAGDKHFAKKASQRIESLFEQTRVLVLSSHSNRILEQFCNKAIWLEKGRLRRYGPLDEVLGEYNAVSQ